MRFPKIALFLAAALALGACSTPRNGTAIVNVTPEVFGNVAPGLSADWQLLSGGTKDRGIAFGCLPENCREPGLIGYMALRTASEIEPLDARIPVSRSLVAKVYDEIANRSGGKVKQVASRKITRSGDVVEEEVTITGDQRKAHALVRITRLPNEVRTVFASGLNREQAHKNMRIALAGMK